MFVPTYFSVVVLSRHIWGACKGSSRYALVLLFFSVFLVSCSGLNFGGSTPTPSSTLTPSYLPLAKLHWCTKPLMIFRDEGAPVAVTPNIGTPTATATARVGGTPTATTIVGTTPTSVTTPTVGAGTPTTITDWTQVQPYLGFTVYLPAMLPRNACLVSVSGTIHDPIFGGSFTIGYLLSDHSSISLAEAPLRTRSSEFQCSPSTSATPQATHIPGKGTPTLLPSPTQAPTQICSGARATTNIYFSARGSTADLQKFFDALQPNVDWIPAS